MQEAFDLEKRALGNCSLTKTEILIIIKINENDYQVKKEADR
ncbi:hypothetical protein AB1J28_13795 [Lysinibacillus irui]